MNPLRHLDPRSALRRLWHLEASPHAIALGAAIGVFWGTTPLFGLKTVLALLTARLVRGHLVAAVIGVTLHDVLLPLLPLLVLWEFRLGCRVLGSDPATLPHLPPLHFSHFQWTVYFDEARPLLVGALIIGLASALATYALLRAVLRHRRD